MLLTRRTNVLLSEADYTMLFNMAKESKKTMGELIRSSLKKTLRTKVKKNRINRDLEASIKSCWKLLLHPEIPVDYKTWIEDGRKY